MCTTTTTTTMKEQVNSKSTTSSFVVHPPTNRNDSQQQQYPVRTPNPLTNATWISRLLFVWPYPLLKIGIQRTLLEEDLPECLDSDTSKQALQYFQQLWDNEQTQTLAHNQQQQQQQQQEVAASTTVTSSSSNNNNNNNTTIQPHSQQTSNTICNNVPKPSLRRAIVRDFLYSTWYVQPLMLMAAIAKIVQAVVLGKLIDTLHGTNIPLTTTTTTTTATLTSNRNDGYFYATLLTICGLILLLEHHHVFMCTWRKGMQLRICCIAALYEKSLHLSSIANSHNTTTINTATINTKKNNDSTTTTTTDGNLMNLASNDVERLLMASLFANYLIWAPLQSIAILCVGCQQLGSAFAVGFAVLVGIFIPLQIYLGGSFAYYRSQIAVVTDQRVTLLSQAIRGCRVVKMSGYENRFLYRIASRRKDEIQLIEAANARKAWNEALFFSMNIVVSLIIFITHVWTGHELNQGSVFTVFTLINILQLEMTKHMSLAVMTVSECWVSIGRIQKFLELPELHYPNESHQSWKKNTIDTDCLTMDKNQFPILSNTTSMTNNTTDTKMETIHSDYNDDSIVVAVAFHKVQCYWNDLDGTRSNQNSPMKRCTNSTNNTSVAMETMMGQECLDTDASTSTTTTNIITKRLYMALQDISVDFCMGQLTAIIGVVGCGKSALLQAIVQEIPISSGSIQRQYRSLSYAAQDPWIMDGTVQENILMGLPLDEEWYQQVIRACGLLLDFAQLCHGDNTILGDRGVQCSGGQRARIGLARALYRDTDVLVVDDPLSAVDAKVGRQLYQEALQGLAVARGKCVILATHQLQYVNDCRCVLLSAGRIQCIGSFMDCVEASDGKLTAHHAVEDTIEGMDGPPILNDYNESMNGILDNVDELTLTPNEETEMLIHANAHKEMNHKGNVERETYTNYLRAMGGIWIGGALFLLFSATQGAVLVTIAQVGRWAERPKSEQKSWDMVGLIIGLGCTVVVLALVRVLVCFHLTIKASQRLHDRMAKAVLRARIQFFDTNPLGRILNRFSADVGITDDQLPPTLYDFFMLSFIVLGAVATTVTTLPFVLVAIPFLGWYFLSVRNVFVTSSRELKRLEGLARSPIFAMLSESMSGIATIRSNGATNFFRHKFQKAHDAHTRSFFSFMAASRWVGFRMDSLVFLLLAVVSFLSVLFNDQGWFSVDPAILGLSLSMLLQLTGLFQWCVRQSAEVVNQMVSVERVLAFGKLDSEASLELPGDKELLASGWPRHGAIQVEDVSVRYRDSLPLALKGISFTIPQGARVGVVGRTGSGKSTVVQTLFRLLESETGRILIDGIDISKLGLHTIRTQISVIPQVPTLFSGCTVRENLDLFGMHSEDALDQVLRDCHLDQMVAEMPNGIDSPVSEGGMNFSVGQRQLLCLARAILSQNRILVLDEATASVDRRTDQLLQEALQKSFQDGTILAVAHRLDTIIEYDYILVLGNGEVLEFDTPANLVQKVNGSFASMVADTGEAMAKELRQRALGAPGKSEENG